MNDAIYVGVSSSRIIHFYRYVKTVEKSYFDFGALCDKLELYNEDIYHHIFVNLKSEWKFVKNDIMMTKVLGELTIDEWLSIKNKSYEFVKNFLESKFNLNI